jgi:hypothetical protein
MQEPEYNFFILNCSTELYEFFAKGDQNILSPSKVFSWSILQLYEIVVLTL